MITVHRRAGRNKLTAKIMGALESIPANAQQQDVGGTCCRYAFAGMLLDAPMIMAVASVLRPFEFEAEGIPPHRLLYSKLRQNSSDGILVLSGSLAASAVFLSCSFKTDRQARSGHGRGC